MSLIPDPLVEPGDGLTPVTVWLDPAHAVRLEALLAHHRECDPATDVDTVVDVLFVLGLMQAEASLNATDHPA